MASILSVGSTPSWLSGGGGGNDSDGGQHKPQYGVGVLKAVGLLVNYSIAAGILVIPWAFYSAGWLLGSIICIVLCLGQYYSNLLVLEAEARANYMGHAECERLITPAVGAASEEERRRLNLNRSDGTNNTISSSSSRSRLHRDHHDDDTHENSNSAHAEEDEDGDGDGDDASSPSLGITWANDANNVAGAAGGGRDRDSEQEPYGVTDPYEFGTLVAIFAGETQATVFELMLVLAAQTTMLAWAVLFSTSWATYVPFGGGMGYRESYITYIFVFLAIEGLWGMLSLVEQSSVQLVMFYARLVFIFVSIATVVVAWSLGTNAFDLGTDGSDVYSPGPASALHWGNLYVVMAVVGLSTSNGAGLAPVVGALREKSQAIDVCRYTTAILTASYLSLGLLLSLYVFCSTVILPSSLFSWL
jgi:hypothetical protein